MINYLESDFWEGADYIKWERSIFLEEGASVGDIRALCEMGLPDWVAPNINFDKYSSKSGTLKIGEDRDDRDIFIELRTLEVKVGSDNQFINTSPYKFRKSLQLYAIMVENAIAIDDNSVVENKIATHLIEDLRAALSELDSACVAKETFWFNELVRLSNF